MFAHSWDFISIDNEEVSVGEGHHPPVCVIGVQGSVHSHARVLDEEDESLKE